MHTTQATMMLLSVFPHDHARGHSDVSVGHDQRHRPAVFGGLPDNGEGASLASLLNRRQLPCVDLVKNGEFACCALQSNAESPGGNGGFRLDLGEL